MPTAIKTVTLHEPATDHGTVLKPEEAALIVDVEGAPKLLLPHFDEEEDVPRLFLLLAAVSVKMADDEWVEEMIEEAFGDES
ncbi:MAG: hypothetical protein ACE5LL_03120 [Alphaproteobacteria bacterium]